MAAPACLCPDVTAHPGGVWPDEVELLLLQLLPVPGYYTLDRPVRGYRLVQVYNRVFIIFYLLVPAGCQPQVQPPDPLPLVKTLHEQAVPGRDRLIQDL